MSLDIEVGLYHGHAVARCPQTGQIAVEPLRTIAGRLQRAGQLHVGADLLAELDYVDDRPQIAGKIAKKLKKAVKKVATVAKKVATSKLGKALLVTASLASGNPAAGAAVLAIGKGKSLAKKAKKNPRGKEAKAAPVAAALAKKKITPKQATAKSKALGVSPSSVKSAAVALRVRKAAKAGNPKAKQLESMSNAIEEAKAAPLPLTMPGGGGGGGGGDPFGDSSSDAASFEDFEQEPAAELDEGESDEGDEGGDEGESDEGDEGSDEYDQSDEYEA